MSAKSRRKRSLQSKKKKMKLRRQTVASQPSPVAVPAEVPVSPPETSVAEKRKPASPPIRDKSPYIFTELRRIGILGGVMLVILIALAVILT